MSYYRKKPIPIEARQYTGDNFLELQDWSNGHVERSIYDDDIDVGGVQREIKNRPESHFCLRTDELIDRVIFSGERAEFGLEDEI